MDKGEALSDKAFYYIISISMERVNLIRCSLAGTMHYGILAINCHLVIC